MLAALEADAWDGSVGDLERGANLCHTLQFLLKRVLVDLPLFRLLKPVVEKGAGTLLSVETEELLFVLFLRVAPTLQTTILADNRFLFT